MKTTMRIYGRTLLVYLIIYALIFSPAVFTPPAAFAAFTDETANRLPVIDDATYSFAVGDIDGDGDLDVFVANGGQSHLLINQGNGAFTEETAGRLPFLNNATLAAVLGDVDGDGDLDLVLANASSPNRLLINDGVNRGVFIESPTPLPPNLQVSMGVELGDLDGDGDLDLVVASRNGQNRVLVNDGRGVFSDATAAWLAADGDPSYAVKLADVNGDQALDLLVVNHGAQNRLFLNTGAGSFTDATDRLPVSLAEGIDAAFADLDGDGDPDLLLVEGADGLHLLVNDGSGRFTDESDARLPALSDFTIKVAVGDLDLDGDLDILLANVGQNRALLNDGRATFSDATALLLPPDDRRTFGAALFDADADRDLDLLLATPGGQNRLLVNDVSTAVPNVVGQVQASAGGAIVAAGLTVGAITTAHSDTVPAGQVISQDPAAGTFAARGSRVDLVVSLGVPVVVPDVVGLAQAAADAAIIAAGLAVGTVATLGSATAPAGEVISQNPAAGTLVAEGSPVDLVVSSGPPVLSSIVVTPADSTLPRGQTQPFTATGFLTDGSTQDLTGAVIWESTNPIFAGIAPSGLVTALTQGGTTIRATKDGVEGSTSLTVVDPALAAIVITPEDPIILTGQTQAFTATGILTDGTSQSLAGLVSWTSSAPAVASINSGTGVASGVAAGTTTIRAARDGITGETGFTVQNRVGDGTSPTVATTSPANNSTLTSPTDIVGTANDANFLKYVLEVARAGQTSFTTLKTGTAPVVNGVLGTFDPTLLLNDLYTLRLTVFDQGGNTRSTSVTYQVARDQKVGNFSIAFQDLNLPLAGLPITVTRTYDSRDKGVGDFGFGWRLDIQTMRVRANRVQGTGWQVDKSGGFLPTFTLVPNDEHKVSLTLPDGRVEEFDFTPTPDSQLLVPFFSVSAAYTPRPGTLGTLAPLGDTDLLVLGDQPGTVELTDFNFDTYDPRTFQYTSPDGRVIIIDKTSGVQSVREPNGNTLTFGSNGITHSSGKSVAFVRDGQGRITQMNDPNGNIQRYAYNANGDLVSHTDPLGNTTRFYYNLSHGLIEIQDPRGISPARNEYDNAGRLIAHTDANGNRIEYTHDLNARQEVVRDRRGNITVFNYDAAGNILSRTDPLGNTTTFTYDARGNKLSETDPLGNTNIFTYDARDNLLTQADPLGSTTSFTYNARNQVLTTTDPLFRTTTNTYDADGNLLTVTDPLGNTTTHTYDASGNRLSTRDSLGNTTAYEYDGFGNLIRQTDPLGRVTTYTYDANGNRLDETTARTDELGNQVTMTTTNTYDANNRLIRTMDPDSNSTFTEYDAIGKKSATTDKNGNRTTFEYDQLGNLSKSIHPDGTTEMFTYDANGNQLSFADRGGRTTRYEYDALNRKTREILPDGSSASTEYDSIGRIIAAIDENGNRTSFEYDAAGRKVRVIDALGNMMTFAYDANDNQTSMTDANHNTTNFEYDAIKRKTRTVFPDVTFTTMAYDGLGRKISETDQAGNTMQFLYDALGRLTRVTDALGQVTTYTYDEVGNKLTQNDANGNTTRWAYDSLGRIVKRVLPPGMSETFTYDPNGNVLTKTDLNGQTIGFTYDVNNRLTRKTYPDTTQVSFTYTATGQRAAVTDLTGVTSYSYDLRDRLVGVVNPDGRTLGYAYDPAGNRTSVVAPSGTTTYTYDALNRLSTVADPRGGVTRYTYDLVGNRDSVTYPNGTVARYTYDGLNRLILLENRKSGGGMISSYTYTLGPTGNRLRVVEDTGRTVNYTYDALYRLVREEIPIDPVLGAEDITYTYDPVGNRLTKTDSNGVTNYAYDANDRLITEGVNTYTYDNNGNTLSKSDGVTTPTYAYDFENRLISAQVPGTITNGYDADGIRTRSTVNGAVTNYLVDKNLDLAQVLEERDGSGALIVSYVYGDDLISQERSGIASFYHYDGLGSTRALTNSSETITDTYTYDAFGILLGSTGNTLNNYLFAGEQLDPNVGFYYLRARYYNQAIGRFVTTDSFEGTIFDPVSLHKYLYARNNPVNWVDPSGNEFSLSGLAISMAIGGIINSIANFNSEAAFSSLATNFLIGALEGALFYGAMAGVLKVVVRLGRFVSATRAARAISAVLSRVKDAGPIWEGTHIPRFFSFSTRAGKFFISGGERAGRATGATKHMVEMVRKFVTEKGMDPKVASSIVLTDLEAAIAEASLQGIKYGQKMIIGKWELIFEAPRQSGHLIKLFHALRRGASDLF